jgi:hypothetical protein
MNKKSNRFSPEMRARAVRMVHLEVGWTAIALTRLIWSAIVGMHRGLSVAHLNFLTA